MAHQKDDPEGLSGWLIFPLLGLLFIPFNTGYTLFCDFIPGLLSMVWSSTFSSGPTIQHGLWIPYLITMSLLNSALFGGAIWLLVMAYQKNAYFPEWIIKFYLLDLTAAITDLVAMNTFIAQVAPGHAIALEWSVLWNFIRALVTCLVGIPYFRRSVRVQNTFVE